MTTFFDFNLPCLEGETKIESEKKKRKDSRLKSVVKLMELGYSGVAYNHTIKGVMADSDRCGIPLFPLSSLLKVAPTISNTVKFHKELLGVPLNTSFRQYTRLTLMADSAIHVSALNSGNPVLKTYDLIVVRPLSQNAFDQACKVSELDGIASAVYEMSNTIDSSPIQGVLHTNNDLFISPVSNFRFNLSSPKDNQTLEPISPHVSRDELSPSDGMEGGVMMTHVMPLKHVHNTSNQNIEEILLDPESRGTSIEYDVPMREVLVQEKRQESLEPQKENALLPPTSVSSHENYETEVSLNKMEGDQVDKTFVVCNEPLETSTNNGENMHYTDVIMDNLLSKEIFEMIEEKKQEDGNFIAKDVSFNRISNKLEEQKIIGDFVPSHSPLPRVKPGNTKGRAPPEILLPFKGLLRTKLFKKKGRHFKS